MGRTGEANGPCPQGPIGVSEHGGSWEDQIIGGSRQHHSAVLRALGVRRALAGGLQGPGSTPEITGLHSRSFSQGFPSTPLVTAAQTGHCHSAGKWHPSPRSNPTPSFCLCLSPNQKLALPGSAEVRAVLFCLFWVLVT